MEENNKQELPKKESTPVMGGESFSLGRGTESSQSLEDSLEHFEPELEKIDQLTNEIEEKSDEFVVKTKDPSLFEKNQQILNELYSKGEIFLRQISERLANYPKGVAESFRDKHIKNKASNLTERFTNNKILRKYNQLSYSYSNGRYDTPESKIIKEKAIKSFDSIYKNSLSLLKTIESDNWAKSKNGKSAKREVNYLLKSIAEQGLPLEKYDEVFNIIKIYENNLSLTSNGEDNKYFSGIISHTVDNFYKDRTIPDDEKMSEICRNDPYLILKYTDRDSSYDLDKKSDFIEQQLDKIINESKENSCCNLTANKYFEKSLRFNPEKYGLDPKSKMVIFESFKSEGVLNKCFNYLEKNSYFFKQELNSLPENEINKIIESYSSYDINQQNAQLLLAEVNLSEDNLKKLFKKTKGVSFEENENKYSKELVLQSFKNSGNLFIPFFKYKQFNLTSENRISLFREIINSCHSGNIFNFFIQVLSNFKDVFEGIPEYQYEEKMNQLIDKSIYGSIEDIRMLHSLLPEYDVPPKYKEQINQMFSEKYSERDNRTLNKVFGGSREAEGLSKQEEWLIGNKEINPRLEVEFFSRGYMEDFRHYFFDVIEGKRESTNKDLLIKKYAERIGGLNSEEYIDLFITKKKIPIEYSGIFLEKIQDGDALLSQLETSARLNQISEEEYKNILVDLVNRSIYPFAEKSLDICLEKNIIENTEKGKLLENFAKNIAKQASLDWHINEYVLEDLMTNRRNSANITEEEKVLFYNKLFKEFLSDEKLNNRIIEITNSNAYFFKQGFSNEKEKEDFINKLLLSNNNNAIGELLNGYLGIKDNDRNPEEDDNPIISTLNEEKFNTLFEHGLSLEGLSVDNVLLSHLSSIQKDKKELFFQNLLAKEDILKNSKNNEEEIRSFCVQIAYWVEKDKRNEGEKIISDEVAKNISTKFFSSQYINDKAFSELISYHRGFLSSDSDILNQCVLALEKRGGVSNCFSLLRTFESKDSPILTEDQIKKLSIRTMKESNISETIYSMYLNSTKDNLKFYLDQELFDKNIKKMCETYTDIDIGSSIGFLILQKKEKDSPNENNNHIVLNNEQEEALNRKIIRQKNIDTSNFEQLSDLDKQLFDTLLDDMMVKKELPIPSISKFILTKGEISDAYFNKIIDYYMASNSNINYVFDNICDRYLTDPALLKETKDKINNLSNIENRSIFKSKLLQRDLLSKEELKTFYEEIRSEPNVYSQVLLSAEVLGSLVYSDSLGRDNHFESENKETQKSIEFISSFVKKYSQESKGRSIAVMLFSREYLPERNMNEVIEKVADTLSKYERVLEQYKYEGIPKGLRASIGMEYEITNSTALGYKEIKDRDLKSDIVRLSQAAHIGNGKDAVHEIATRPATNPYLLLLEMQLLNDIEYIDLNFDRTELYQKGARGFHVTIGGETGLYVNADTNFLQNSILAASWGGIHAGETGKRVSGGRGVTLRGRSANGGNNNVKVFEKATDSVELRSLSIDKMEPFQRAIVTTFNGAIAIQALEKYTNCTSDKIYEFYKSDSSINNENEFIEKLKESGNLKEGYDSDEKNLKIVYAWAELTSSIKDALDYHNNEFLEGETIGYLDKDGVWVDTKDFGGNYNNSRFDSVVTSIDPTLSVKEYVNSTNIKFNEFFSSFDIELADSLTKINNLYLKPGNKKVINKNGKEITIGGDQANSISMLEVTKLNNEELEYRNDDSYLKGTVFDTLGERREGYYCVQGGSEKMITHACQIALLNFNKRIEEIVNK